MAITNLTGTTWLFNESTTFSNYGELVFNINFTSNTENFYKLTKGSYMGYQPIRYDTLDVYTGTWITNSYRKITITSGADVENETLIAFLQENAIQLKITNLTNTTWVLNKTLSFNEGHTWSVNFKSYVSLASYGGGEARDFIGLMTDIISYRNNLKALSYNYSNIGNISVYEDEWNDTTTDETRIIEITGGADVENADLIIFLTDNARPPLEFTETKSALKIYEDLTEDEYFGLVKEPNSFYLVNGKGLYKGNKLVATKNDISFKEPKHTFELSKNNYGYYTTNDEIDSLLKQGTICALKLNHGGRLHHNYCIVVQDFGNYEGVFQGIMYCDDAIIFKVRQSGPSSQSLTFHYVKINDFTTYQENNFVGIDSITLYVY